MIIDCCLKGWTRLLEVLINEKLINYLRTNSQSSPELLIYPKKIMPVVEVCAEYEMRHCFNPTRYRKHNSLESQNRIHQNSTCVNSLLIN